MKCKDLILIWIVILLVSCDNKPIENIDQYFGTADTADIGVLRYIPWNDSSLDFFIEPSDTTRFATLTLSKRGMDSCTDVFSIR
jgi:hypothetical protein